MLRVLLLEKGLASGTLELACQQGRERIEARPSKIEQQQKRLLGCANLRV